MTDCPCSFAGLRDNQLESDYIVTIFFMDTFSFVNDTFLDIPRIPILDHTQRFIPIVGVDSLDPINFGGFEPV